MHLLYNRHLILESDFNLSFSNRACQYGDGFFETLILENDKIRFWAEHVERMQEAMAVLQLTAPANSDFFPSLRTHLTHLAEVNNCSGLARIKLNIWRSGTGLYTPTTDEFSWLATAALISATSEEIIKAKLCTSVRTIPSIFSTFKGINSPVYVLASREKIARKVDDVVLLDPNGRLAELTSANLFWVKEKKVFTPALETGCVNGIMRRRALAWAKANNWSFEEGFYKLEDIAGAELVFAGNVTGLKAIRQIENEIYDSDIALLSKLKKEIFKG